MSKIGDLFFIRKHHVCPRWLCFTFDNWIRRRLQNPDQIIKPYVREGDTVVDVGPGIGFFTIPIARLVGYSGHLIAVDIQEEMLTAISQRAIRAGVADRISTQLASPVSLNVTVRADFILAFWMAHEVPDSKRLFGQLHDTLKGTGRFLLAEPKVHVTEKHFHSLVDAAVQAGFTTVEYPSVALSRAALFKR